MMPTLTKNPQRFEQSIFPNVMAMELIAVVTRSIRTEVGKARAILDQLWDTTC